MTRLSIHKSDPGYSPQAYQAKVYVDGKELQHCFTADEELGVAFCYKKDEYGEFILTASREELVEFECEGDVVITV